jgi:hypothetical protein
MQSTTHFFIDQTLFPGSHCLHAPILPRLTLKSDEFMRMRQMPLPVFEEWISMYPQLQASIPQPPPRSTALPERALLIFEDPVHLPVQDGAAPLFSVKTAVMFFRRGEPTTPEEISSVVLPHLEHDVFPVLETLEQLGADMKTLRDGLLDGFMLVLIKFYETIDPVQMQPVLNKRVFSLEDEPRYIGRFCAACGTLNAHHQCPCRAGIYYCDKACQTRHWKQHKRSCTARNNKI